MTNPILASVRTKLIPHRSCPFGLCFDLENIRVIIFPNPFIGTFKMNANNRPRMTGRSNPPIFLRNNKTELKFMSAAYSTTPKAIKNKVCCVFFSIFIVLLLSYNYQTLHFSMLSYYEHHKE